MFEFQHNKDISHLTTFGIPAKAKHFAEYSSVKELIKLSRTEEFLNNEILHIGGGSNLLFVNDFDGLILHSAIKGIEEYRKDNDTVFAIVGAGVKWTEFVDWCIEKGYAGVENLAHIPGEVGASAIQNVGAYGVEAKDVIFSVEAFDVETRKLITLTNQQCRFGYRDSIFKHEAKGRYFIIRVSFKLTPSTEAKHLDYGPLKSLEQRLGHKPSIKEVHSEIIDIRSSKLPDPQQIGSAGSFFKNPVVNRSFFEKVILKNNPNIPFYEVDDNNIKLPAGWLIEHAGLKGYQIGGAKVFENQCLVIINQKNATGKDVVALSEHIRNVVLQKFSVVLQPEVNFIDTNINVTFLGTGTSKGVPEVACKCPVCISPDNHDKRLRASILVKTHGMNLLIDASPDFRHQALKHNIIDIDATLITHSHYDHVGGIDDLRPFCGDAGHKLPLFVKKDVADDLQRRIDYCFREHPYPGVPTFNINLIPDVPFYLNGLKITPIFVNHANLPIVGFRIGDFAYITDAKTIDERELDKLHGLKTLVINALRYEDHFSHLSVDEALKIVDELKPQQTFFTHMNHDIGLHHEVNAKLPNGVKLAFDGLKIIVE